MALQSTLEGGGEGAFAADRHHEEHADGDGEHRGQGGHGAREAGESERYEQRDLREQGQEQPVGKARLFARTDQFDAAGREEQGHGAIFQHEFERRDRAGRKRNAHDLPRLVELRRGGGQRGAIGHHPHAARPQRSFRQ
jgi:hypothetical protein